MINLRNILIALGTLLAGFVFALLYGSIVNNSSLMGEQERLAGGPNPTILTTSGKINNLPEEQNNSLPSPSYTALVNNLEPRTNPSTTLIPTFQVDTPATEDGRFSTLPAVTNTPNDALGQEPGQTLTPMVSSTLSSSPTSVPITLQASSPVPVISVMPFPQEKARPTQELNSTPTSNPLADSGTLEAVMTITPTEPARGISRIIGFSGGSEDPQIDPLPITSYQFKNGPNKVLFVGGIHGGYEWNTIMLAYEMIDYFTENLDAIPDTMSLFIIPSANPYGQKFATGKEGRFDSADVQDDSLRGRFNAGNVDINRNFDCQWQEEAYWRDQRINAGSSAFSEPESITLRDFIYETDPLAVIFWHSVANGVFAASCDGELFNASMDLAEVYGEASKYPVYETFTAYPITGDASDWLVLESIPAITVELATSNFPESSRNLEGMKAIFDYYKDWPSFPRDAPK